MVSIKIHLILCTSMVCVCSSTLSMKFRSVSCAFSLPLQLWVKVASAIYCSALYIYSHRICRKHSTRVYEYVCECVFAAADFGWDTQGQFSRALVIKAHFLHNLHNYFVCMYPNVKAILGPYSGAYGSLLCILIAID